MAGGEEDVHPAGAERGRKTAELTARREGWRQALAASLGLMLSLCLFWPGIALYDSVDQYRQVLGGEYSDWHPPAMARLWSLFAGRWPGGAPMLSIQLALYWLGFGLIAAACARRGARSAAWAVLVTGTFFLTSCWLGAILKDAQMVGALIGATGLAAWFRIQAKPLPWPAAILVVLLLGYAAMVRANAIFAMIPLGFALFRIGRRWPRPLAVGAATAAILASIALMPVVNHHLFGAEASGVEKSLLVYDLAGIAAASDPWARQCYSSREWDKAGEPGCAGSRLLEEPTVDVAGQWAAAILHHPYAYAAHRLAHFSTTMRWIVPANLPGAVSPVEPQPNSLGLGAPPGKAALALHRIGGWAAWLPIAWPSFWLALDLVAFWAAWTAEGELAAIAFPLSLSALVTGASFLAISVASDLRYHLWTMIASAIAIILLAAGGSLRRSHWLAGLAMAILVSLTGLAARLLLPPFA